MSTATTERKAKNNYVRGGGMLIIAPRDTTTARWQVSCPETSRH